jgi:hypothetical protein
MASLTSSTPTNFYEILKYFLLDKPNFKVLVMSDLQCGPDCDDDTGIAFLNELKKLLNFNITICIPSHFSSRYENVKQFCNIIGFPIENIIIQGHQEISTKYDLVYWIAELTDSSQILPFVKEDGILVIQGGIGENSVNITKCEAVDETGQKTILDLPEKTIFVPSSKTIKCKPNKQVMKYFNDYMPSLYEMQIRSFIALILCRCNTDKVYALGLISENFGRAQNLYGLIDAYNQLKTIKQDLPNYENIPITDFNREQAETYVDNFYKKHDNFVMSTVARKKIEKEYAKNMAITQLGRMLGAIQLMTNIENLPLMESDQFVIHGGNLVDHDFTRNQQLKVIAESFVQPLHDLMAIIIGLMYTTGYSYNEFYENPSENLLEIMNSFLPRN